MATRSRSGQARIARSQPRPARPNPTSAIEMRSIHHPVRRQPGAEVRRCSGERPILAAKLVAAAAGAGNLAQEYVVVFGQSSLGAFDVDDALVVIQQGV